MKQIQYMTPFNHTEHRYTQNCLVIIKQKVNVNRIEYKYSKINKNFFTWSVFTDYQPLFQPLHAAMYFRFFICAFAYKTYNTVFMFEIFHPQSNKGSLALIHMTTFILQSSDSE